MSRNEHTPTSIARVKIEQSESGAIGTDNVVVEEPLEIRLKQAGHERQLGITMRTPGADLELAAGFLWGEGFLHHPRELLTVKVCGDLELTPRQRANVVVAEIDAEAGTPPRNLERRFTMSSACGVCGSTSIGDLHLRGVGQVVPNQRSLSELAGYTQFLDGRQHIFAKTGGLHAAALVNPRGEVVRVREDVGRHNAVDKVIGASLMAGELPLHNYSLVVSGRIGYEIVQKAVVAGISAVIGVSAPTSLAIDLADEFGLTLLGFARNGAAKRFRSAD